MKLTILCCGLLLSPVLATSAFAQCLPVNPGNGDAVTCDPDDTNGFSDGSDAISITVKSGVTVSNTAGEAIRARGTGVSIVNDGIVKGLGASNDGIDGGVNLSVTNTGEISGTNRGIDADDKNGLKVENSGSIYALDKAIRNGAGVGSSLTNSGTVESESDEGFEAGDDAKVVNSGTITASDDGVQVDENAIIENSGIIRSVQRGVVDAADPQDAIDIDSGAITNTATGLIESDDDAAIDYDESTTASTIDNYGTIRGTTGILVEKDPAEGANTAAQTITLFDGSLLEGTDGLALDIGAGDDALLVYAGATVLGGGDFGTGDDTLRFLDDITGDFGCGCTMNGGEGDDTVIFDSFVFDDVLFASFDAARRGLFNQVLQLVLDNGAGPFELALENWEFFEFSGARYTLDEVVNGPAPVPLPAGMALMLPALGALGLLARRRRAA